jgi:hypothetical protein
MMMADVDWTLIQQVKAEARYELQNGLYAKIHEYSAICQERGISNYFISGLEVAAGIVQRGDLPKPDDTGETDTLL